VSETAWVQPAAHFTSPRSYRSDAPYANRFASDEEAGVPIVNEGVSSGIFVRARALRTKSLLPSGGIRRARQASRSLLGRWDA
jgi:hypothetical protein